MKLIESKANVMMGKPVIAGSRIAEECVRDRLASGGWGQSGYAVLLSTILQNLFAIGLDPTFGICHVARESSTSMERSRA